jgi:hypothetical protein
MPDIISILRNTYASNPAAALNLLPELFKQYDEGLIKVLPCKEFYSKSGDTVFLIDDGDIIEVLHCGASIDADGKVNVAVAAEDKIFPNREPNAEIDTDPTDWCTNAKIIAPEDFEKNVRFTRPEAEEALKERDT